MEHSPQPLRKRLNPGRFNPRLMAILDVRLLGGRSATGAVRAMVAGGATMIQLREPKARLARDFIADARAVKAALKKYPAVKFIVNDRADIAAAVGADGVHLGQDDLPVASARTILGKKKIIGVSVETASQARRATRQGADYLAVGAIFPTPTKTDARVTGLEALKKIKKIARTPVVAIGGIDAGNAGPVIAAGADGIAAIGAILKGVIRHNTILLARAIGRARPANG